jgi:regulatory protein
MQVTAIEGRARGRWSIYLDGLPALSLAAEIVKAHGLRVGQHLSSRQVAELAKADEVHRARQAALRYLEYRPRSEKEVRDRLRRGGFTPHAIDAATLRLKELGLIDDASFARFWRDSREAHRPTGRRLLQQELRRKGVDAEVIGEVLEGADDEAGAYRAALKKARSLRACDEDAFRRRLGTFLQRRGYGYDLARRVVEQLWQERRIAPG